jgi:hypothetical protein
MFHIRSDVARCKNRMRSRRVIFLIFSVRGGWGLIDSLLATVASQKLQSAYYWVCNRSITLENICCRWGVDCFIVSNRCITEVAIGILLSLQPVNYTRNICLQVGGVDWFIVSNRCITEVAIDLLLSLQPVNYTRNVCCRCCSFLSHFCFCNLFNCRSCNYNHSRSL